ncbi:hypothetical protein ACFQJ5_08215 [Halomicroarcula sp. GCM10025324]|uniref:hypothetical protein n=1 Tax=Haloarcula TaxID=2237 RepID=UPI0023E8EBB1|nr:hypothetical protein [Halomicroarcula sp. ZS-22-S1]
MSDDGYLVRVKPSARKVSAPAGRWVNRHGPRRVFETKALAREWARACRGPTAPVWLQDAPPWADDEADGYLVGRTRERARTRATGSQQTLADTER